MKRLIFFGTIIGFVIGLVNWQNNKKKGNFICLVQMRGCPISCGTNDLSPEKDVCKSCYYILMQTAHRRMQSVNLIAYCENCGNVGPKQNIGKPCNVTTYYCLRCHTVKPDRKKGEHHCNICHQPMEAGKKCTYPLRLFMYDDVPSFQDEFLSLALRRGWSRWSIPSRFMEAESRHAQQLQLNMQRVSVWAAQRSAT